MLPFMPICYKDLVTRLYDQTLTCGLLAGLIFCVAMVPQGAMAQVRPSPNLTIAPIAQQTYGAEPLTVSTSSRSNAAISYAVLSGPAVMSANVLTPTAVGVVVVSASQVGSASYSAQTVTAAFVVVPAVPNLSLAAPGSVVFGSSSFPISASSPSSGSIGFTVLSGPATIVGNVVTPSGSGTLILRATQSAAGNYTSQTTSIAVAVVKATPSLIFAPIGNQTFGASQFTVLASSQSTGAVTYAVVSGPAFVGGNLVTITGTGLVTLTATQAADINYTSQTATTTFSATPGTPSLSFAPIATQVYGGRAVAVVATSKSAAPITYSIISGPGTIVGGLVTTTGVGSVIVQAAQAATPNYLAQTTTTSITVAGASPNLIVSPIGDIVFGHKPFALSSQSMSPGPITYSVSSGPAALVAGLVNVTGTGLVSVGATQAASGNYAAQTVTMTFRVVAAVPALIFAPVGPQTYGPSRVLLSATSASTGGVSYSVLSGPGAISGNLLTLTGAGAITINASQAPDANYTSQTATMTIAVAPAAPVLTFGPLGSVTFGAQPFAISASSTSGAPITYTLVSGPAFLTGNILTLTGAGSVTIQASQPANSNYLAQTAQTMVSVSRATPTLTFTSVPPHIAGDPPFTVTATSNSPGPISYSIISGPATIQGSTVTLTGLGLVVIGAAETQNGNYNAQTASLPVTVSPEVLAISPATANVLTGGGSQQFSATRNSAPAQGGQWIILGGTGNGSIDANGVFQAPANVSGPDQISVGYVLNGSMATATVSLVLPTSQITSTTPSTLTQLTTNTLVAGTGFSPASTVLVNGCQMPTTFVDSSHLQVVITLLSSSIQTVSLQLSNSGSGSPIYLMPAALPQLAVSPASLSGGQVNLRISGKGITSGSSVTLNGITLTTAFNPDSSITASGFLTPWTTGAASLAIATPSGVTMFEESLPINPTPISYDTASRFLTQSAFGPRPGLVEHVQQIGLSAFLTEQMAQPSYTYNYVSDAKEQFIVNAIQGNSVLRQRVAWALQNFMVSTTAGSELQDMFAYEEKLENDAFGNFRQLMSDVAVDTSIAHYIGNTGNYYYGHPEYQPNQNYAREFLQLFTIGTVMINDDGSPQLDVNGNTTAAYSQDTINNFSRVLTGWNYGPPAPEAETFLGVNWNELSTFDAWHDPNAKTIFNASLPAGQTAQQDLNSALDAVFQHQNLPPFICKLLIQHLVKSAPSPQYIFRVAQVFKDDGNGVRGNLAAVIPAILLDPEARAGDTTAAPDDGFLQEPVLFQLFAMNALQMLPSDNQVDGSPGQLGQDLWSPGDVFGYYSPSYIIPGTALSSPEFMLLNNISIVQRSELLLGMVQSTLGGYTLDNSHNWLYTNFPTVPLLVDALNHLAYHGKMPSGLQTGITNYGLSLGTPATNATLQTTVFLALNADSYTVSH